jgi:beta-barrel assembly-enhancing protease
MSLEKKVLRLLGAGALAFHLAAPPPVVAQSQAAKPGFNLFSRDQEIELGRRSAAEIERQLPLVRDASVQGFASRVIERLAAQAPGERYPYQIKVVNASDVNAFALPGGFMYVNRGLLQVARSEGEVAGVLAHEMAHVALRHGTHQASKTYATKAGVGILGGLLGLGRGGSSGDRIVNAVGGLGLNALFMKFSRDDEYQADLVGAQIMHRAGYDAREMARFFELLQGMRSSNAGAVAQFFSSHPSPDNRAQRIRTEAARLGPARSPAGAGGLAAVQAELRGMGRAPSLSQIQRGQVPARSSDTRSSPRVTPGRVEAPSGRYRRYDQRNGFFNVQYPDNWRVYEAEQGLGVTIAPEGGVVETADGTPAMVYGVVINHFDPFEQGSYARRRTPALTSALDDLLAQVMRSNTHLRRSGGTRRLTLDGAPALQAVLSGTSRVTGMEERVTAVVRELSDGHVAYALFVAPGRDYAVLAPTFDQMVRSLRVDDAVAHR